MQNWRISNFTRKSSTLGWIPWIFTFPTDSCSTRKAIIVTADISKCVGGLPSPSQPSPVKNPSAAPIYESRAQVSSEGVYSRDTMIFQKQLRLAREKSNPPKPAVTPNPKRTTTRDKSQKLYHIDKFEKLGKWFSSSIKINFCVLVFQNLKKWNARIMPFVEAMNRPHCHLDLQSRLIKFAITWFRITDYSS